MTGITGQLWYTTLDVGDNQVAGYFNSDGTFITQVGATSQAGLAIGVDTAAGYYFIANGDGTSISSYRISDNALIGTVQVGDASAFELVNSIAVDPVNHVIFANRWDTDLDHTGIVQISYDPMTGALDPTAAFDQSPSFLLTGTSTGGNYVNATNFEIDTATHKLYYTDWDNNYGFAPFTPTNAIYVVSDYTAASPTVTKLTDDTQFPADMSNGIIGNIAIDDAKGLIYFTTLDAVDPGQGHVWYMSMAGGMATKIADLDNLNLGGVPTGLSLDTASQQLYISTAYYDAPGGGGYPNDPTANANHVLVYQLSMDGHSFDSLVASYTLDQLEGDTPSGTGAHPGASVWNQLPVLSLTNPGAHAIEQGSAITAAGSFSSSDDGGYYTGAVIQITGGTFSSNETSSADDHLFVLDGSTQRTSGTFTGTNITVSYDSGTEKLTLSGYDTIAHYNTVMSAAGYFATGDNPTNYGNNDTRTVTWTVSDGSQNVPPGQGQNTTTSTITIDAVNDAPVNAGMSAKSGNEDQAGGIAITGLSVSDVDADPANQDITVRLQVTHGTITINTGVSGGLTAGGVTGNNSNDVLLTGTQNQINATLANATGAVYFSTADYNGTDALTITTNDGGHTGTSGALTDVDSIAITINAVTDIANDTATTNEDTVVNILVQANDTFENPNHAITGTTNGANGTVTVNNNGTVGDTTDDFVVYTPNADFNGSDSFTYTVTSGGATETATVNVTINAVADIVDDSVTVAQNSGANNLNLLANDTFESAGRAITAVSAASHGTTAINDNGTPGDATDDFVVYTPNASYSGPDSFTYTVTSGGVTETGNVSVTVAPNGQLINGGNGNDTLNGTAGDDTINGNGGNDTINAGDGNDTISGGGGNDTLNGQGGNDTIFGNEGNDTINAGDGNDTVSGGQGDDILNGQGGNDTIFGNDGNDRIVGGAGNDTMTGGAGNDTFAFGPSFGQDIVTDFKTIGNDRIEFDHTVFANFAAVQAAMTQVGTDTVITHGTDALTLQNVTTSSLHASDFLFV